MKKVDAQFLRFWKMHWEEESTLALSTGHCCVGAEQATMLLEMLMRGGAKSQTKA